MPGALPEVAHVAAGRRLPVSQQHIMSILYLTRRGISVSVRDGLAVKKAEMTKKKWGSNQKKILVLCEVKTLQLV